MKQLSLLFIAFIFIQFNMLAQSPEFIWARQAGSTDVNRVDSGESITTDGLGNCYVTGVFVGTATFGSTTLISAGGDDIFVAKYNADGNLLWAHRGGGSSRDRGSGIATDGSGNCYVTGYFEDTATFGSITLTSAHVDFFIAKYDAGGNVIWVQQAGSTANGEVARGKGITTDGSGNCYVTGSFCGVVTFGNITLTSNCVNGGGFFIAKYNSNGNVLWAQQSVGAAWGMSIANDGANNIYTTGNFNGGGSNPVYFGNIALITAGNNDIFIAKYDASGNVLWAHRGGGSGNDEGSGIATDGSGNCYVTGQFRGTATFGSTTISGGSAEDIFVAKYDAGGNVIWVKQAGQEPNTSGNYYDRANSISTDGSGNWFLTGKFTVGTFFGLTNFPYGAFIASFDENWNLLWNLRDSGHSYFGGHIGYNGFSSDGSGNSVVTGSFRDTVFFGNTPLATTNSDDSDVFVASIGLTNDIQTITSIPVSFKVDQNYPNPFNPKTTIKYQIPEHSFVSIKLYDVLGNEVSTLVNEEKPLGSYEVEFNATDLPSGIYFYRLQAGSYVETKKMVLLK